MKDDQILKTEINYPKEKLIKDFKVGQCFACGDEIWVKINEDSCAVIGKEKIVKFTSTCAAFPVTSIGAYL